MHHGTFKKHRIVSALASHFRCDSEIILPKDNRWSAISERWTKYLAPSFRVAVKPGCEADLVAIVKYADLHNIRFLAQGGRHGFAPELGTIQNGILIDLENMNHVHVNNKSQLVTIGGGVKFQDAIDTLYAAGREMSIAPTIGSCPCVGVLGAVLGGGHGRLQGLYGLSIDAMKRLRVVLANGSVITVSEYENSNLWWGMRGAGQNFGIVIEADFQTYAQVSQGQFYDVEMAFADEKLESALEVMNNQIIDQPGELAVNIIFGADSMSLQPTIAINLVYAGTTKDGRKYSDPWKNLGPHQFVEANYNWAELPSKTAKGFIAAQCAEYGYKNTYSVNLQHFDIPTARSVFDSWKQFLGQHPNVNASTLLFEVFGQKAIEAVPDISTAYPSRHQENILLVITSWYTDLTLTSTVDNWTAGIRSELNKTSGYDKLYVYQNYAHSEPLQAIYGDEPWRLQRLGELKREFDPNGWFNAYHPVPATL
ncbi:MAG: hypothetical protein Q9190_000003 [Brigantiaea leucoxantha]